MQILLIGADGPQGLALQAALSRWGRHELTPVTMASARWKSERQAKKVVRRSQADIIVDVRLPQLLAAGDECLVEADVERCHWLAKACQRDGSTYLLLSSDRVFSGQITHPYREQETPDACDVPGQLMIAAEGMASASCARHFILRTGPLFAAAGDNPFTRVMRGLLGLSTQSLNDRDWMCPVPVHDLARVISGVLDQLGVGAQAWGFFHYCTTDRTTLFGFGESVMATLSQYTDLDGAAIERALLAENESVTRVLDCRDLRDTFAIKQLPWRGAISAMVDAYLKDMGTVREPEAHPG